MTELEFDEVALGVPPPLTNTHAEYGIRTQVNKFDGRNTLRLYCIVVLYVTLQRSSGKKKGKKTISLVRLHCKLPLLPTTTAKATNKLGAISGSKKPRLDSPERALGHVPALALLGHFWDKFIYHQNPRIIGSHGNHLDLGLEYSVNQVLQLERIHTKS